MTDYRYDKGRAYCTALRMNPADFAAPLDACVLGSAGTFGPDRITDYAYDLDGKITKKLR